ncbi:ATP-binding cassette domain-containing protein [Anaerotignum sp. MB30-C6]|uniref:ATP-binding cassette domain-containing protein n=1 Tax=Anaerotignum sp. MB30-C6 TaxID=3070814 RepID=UPI0027DB0F0D|nr:ATP-binding cassette domain-containing protein [Anaerotignum sp. MB30-C6]WMI79906.1 ATP-binding cassette domain-containing protein [Anaerotignum sp. MB30-C6]
MSSKSVLSVKNLSVSFSQYVKGLKQKIITPIGCLNIDLKAGEVHAVIGASGSGKSLLAHAVLGILPSNAICSGTMDYMGEPLTEKRIKQLRGKEIAFIPQSVNYLDPLMKVGKQIKIGLPKESASKTEAQLLQQYGLKQGDKERYPFELSGGMLRRILFATSVREGVKLVIADEPTPGIHPEALSAILNQLRAFADEGASVMLITHDIVSALSISDRVTVLREGEAIETVDVDCFHGKGEKLSHPYTKALWRSLPTNEFTLYQEVKLCH